MKTETYHKAKKRKIETTIDGYQEHHIGYEDTDTVEHNLDSLESTMKLVVEKLNGFEQILQTMKDKLKTKITKIDSSSKKEFNENEGETITLAFPLQTIEEISQFESDDLDSIVETFMKNLFTEHKQFSVVFKYLLRDDLIVKFPDWESMSRYRFFSEILYEATKDNFAEYDDFVLEMRKQIMKAVNRARSNT